MNAPYANSEVTDVEDTSKAIAVVTNERLVIDEILDAEPKDANGNVISRIVPLNYGVSGAFIAELRTMAATIAKNDAATPEGKRNLKEFATKCSKLKSGMDEAYKEWNGPIMAMTKAAREQKEHAQTIIAEIAAPIDAKLEAQRAEENRVKNEKAAAESARQSAHAAAMHALETLPNEYVSALSVDIAAKIAEVSSFDYLTKRDWEEFALGAADLQRAAIEKLNVHLTNAKAREELADLRAKQDAENAARAQAEAAATAERERVEALRARIHNIQIAPSTAVGSPAASIAKTIERLDTVDVSEFGDMAQDAQAAIDSTRAALTTLHAQAAQAEADAAELAEFRASKEKRQRDEAAKAAEAQRVAAEEERERQRADTERQAAEQRAAHERIERMRAHAASLLDLVTRARPYVDTASLTPTGKVLLADIDAAIAAVEGN